MDHVLRKHLESASLTVECIENEPKSFSEALQRPDGHLWKAAMKAEWDALEKNGTFEIIKKPENLDEWDIVTSGIVYKIKRNSDGEIKRYKARVVAHAYMQTEGVNTHDIFAPVAKLTTFEILLAIVALLYWQ